MGLTNMSSAPTISIITTTHNRRRLLEETINSVLAQSLANWELIVVDDASEDETWRWLQTLSEARIKIFHFDRHSERTKARNLGLETARGEFVLFLDDDDLLIPTTLQTHLNGLARYPSALGAVGGFMKFDAAGARETTRYVRRRRLHDIGPDLLFGHIPVFGQCLFRTEIIKAAGGWRGEFIPIEDHQLWLRIAPEGKVVLQPEILLHYRVHDGQWRPRKLWKLMTKVRQRAIKKIEGKALAGAERILHAREHFRAGENFYAGDETFKALISYLKAVRLSPGVLRSPVTRMMLLPPIMKCLLGGRPVFSKLEPIANRRALEFSRSKIVDDYGENHQPVDGKNYQVAEPQVD